MLPSVRGLNIICSYGNAVSDVIILISLFFFCQKDTAILPLMKSMNQIKLHFQICTSAFSYCPVFLVTVWKPGWEQELQKPEEKKRQDLCLSLAITDIQSVHGHLIKLQHGAPSLYHFIAQSNLCLGFRLMSPIFFCYDFTWKLHNQAQMMRTCDPLWITAAALTSKLRFHLKLNCCCVRWQYNDACVTSIMSIINYEAWQRWGDFLYIYIYI